MRPRTLLAASVIAGGAVTTVSVGSPLLRLAYRSPESHIALETAEGMAALLVVALVCGRYAREPLRHYLFLAAGFGVLAAANLALSVAPTVLGSDGRGALVTWAPATARLGGALLLAAAGTIPTSAVASPRRAATLTALGVGVTVAAIATFMAVLGDHLPSAVDVSLSAGRSAGPRLDGHPAVLAVQGASGLLLAAAAFGFLRRANAGRDQLLAWFAAGAAMSALARLNYLLFPSLYSDYVYTGDILRMASYLLFVIGGVVELTNYWGAVADAAVADDRRRMARDLHDGLAQELSFILRQTRRLGDDERLVPVIAAAERALDESRAAISALTRTADDPPDVVIDQAAREAAARLATDVDLRLDLDRSVTMPVAARDAVGRVVRESVSNAVRHGGATRITVTLDAGPPRRLTIADDGRGYDTDSPRAPGTHGIVSMTERIAAVGGRLHIRSDPGDGTTVEVILP